MKQLWRSIQALSLSLGSPAQEQPVNPSALPVRYESIHRHQCPVLNREGIDYCLVPLFVVESLRSAQSSCVWLAVGSGSLAVVALAAFWIQSSQPVRTVEKAVPIDRPVIVEKEKPVPIDRSCLAFCGNK
jgi:hypothetical protein